MLYTILMLVIVFAGMITTHMTAWSATGTFDDSTEPGYDYR